MRGLENTDLNTGYKGPGTPVRGNSDSDEGSSESVESVEYVESVRSRDMISQKVRDGVRIGSHGLLRIDDTRRWKVQVTHTNRHTHTYEKLVSSS